jgi:hypothetical protein
MLEDWKRFSAALKGDCCLAGARAGRSRLLYFFFEDSSDFLELSFEELSFEPSDLEELSDFEESLDLVSFLDDESPFEEDVAEPVEDFFA